MKLDIRLEQDSEFICDLESCQLRLMRSDIPWFILVPREENLVELTDLDIEKQFLLLKEINFVCSTLKKYLNFDKLNIASIGNIVSQLHIHIVARSATDRAWPNVVWGTKPVQEFDYSRVTHWKTLFNG